MLSHQLGWQVCQLKSWGAWIQCILAAWGKTFLEGRSKRNLVAARGPHYRLSRPRITQNCTRVLTTPAVFPICTNRKFPISYLLLDTEQIRLVPAHWAQLSWMYRSYPVNTRNSSRGHFGAWEHVLCIGEARNAGELPVLEAALHWKPMRLCGLLSQLPCQLRWDLSKVCSAQCLRDPSGSRFQWPSMEPCTEKHAAWTFFLSQTHFPLPSRAFLGCPPKLTTCTWISCLGVCTLVGGGGGQLKQMLICLPFYYCAKVNGCKGGPAEANLKASAWCQQTTWLLISPRPGHFCVRFEGSTDTCRFYFVTSNRYQSINTQQVTLNHWRSGICGTQLRITLLMAS